MQSSHALLSLLVLYYYVQYVDVVSTYQRKAHVQYGTTFRGGDSKKSNFNNLCRPPRENRKFKSCRHLNGSSLSSHTRTSSVICDCTKCYRRLRLQCGTDGKWYPQSAKYCDIAKGCGICSHKKLPKTATCSKNHARLSGYSSEIRHCYCKSSCKNVRIWCTHKSRQWQFKNGDCDDDHLPFVLNDTHRHMNIKFNTGTYTYSCEEGYELRGNNTAHCQDGRLRGQMPNCEAVKLAGSATEEVIHGQDTIEDDDTAGVMEGEMYDDDSESEDDDDEDLGGNDYNEDERMTPVLLHNPTESTAPDKFYVIQNKTKLLRFYTGRVGMRNLDEELKQPTVIPTNAQLGSLKTATESTESQQPFVSSTIPSVVKPTGLTSSHGNLLREMDIANTYPQATTTEVEVAVTPQAVLNESFSTNFKNASDAKPDGNNETSRVTKIWSDSIDEARHIDHSAITGFDFLSIPMPLSYATVNVTANRTVLGDESSQTIITPTVPMVNHAHNERPPSLNDDAVTEDDYFGIESSLNSSESSILVTENHVTVNKIDVTDASVVTVEETYENTESDEINTMIMTNASTASKLDNIDSIRIINKSHDALAGTDATGDAFQGSTTLKNYEGHSEGSNIQTDTITPKQASNFHVTETVGIFKNHETQDFFNVKLKSLANATDSNAEEKSSIAVSSMTTDTTLRTQPNFNRDENLNKTSNGITLQFNKSLLMEVGNPEFIEDEFSRSFMQTENKTASHTPNFHFTTTDSTMDSVIYNNSYNSTDHASPSMTEHAKSDRKITTTAFSIVTPDVGTEKYTEVTFSSQSRAVSTISGQLNSFQNEETDDTFVSPDLVTTVSVTTFTYSFTNDPLQVVTPTDYNISDVNPKIKTTCCSISMLTLPFLLMYVMLAFYISTYVIVAVILCVCRKRIFYNSNERRNVDKLLNATDLMIDGVGHESFALCTKYGDT